MLYGIWTGAFGSSLAMQQEPILYAGTILFNIQCGKESATRQEAVEDVKLPNAHNFMEEKVQKCKTEAASEG